MRRLIPRALLAAQAFTCLLAAGLASAQAAPPIPTTAPAPDGYVSRGEYERLKAEQQEMRQELEAIKKHQAQVQPPTQAAQSGMTDEDREEIDKQIRAIRDDVARIGPGLENVVLAGDAAFGFTAARHTPSTFFAGVAPLVLWQPTDKLLIEAAVDIGVDTDSEGNSSTSVDLTIANASYIVNDYLAVGAGLFVVPFGVYHNHFDPPWIDKFPDDPLAFSDTIAPDSEVGAFARGAVPIGSTKLTYDVYLANGPSLIVTDPNAAGSLNFADFTDLNGNKAVGGRVGFLPVPNLELGYSFQYSQPNPEHFKRVNALLQAVDANWRQACAAIRGTLDARAEWVWSDVDRTTYDRSGALGFGPLSFGNYRTGGYAQLCYRPTMVHNKILRDLEFCVRYDYLKTPIRSPGGDKEQRWTLGVDYWITPAAVLKLAYELDDRKIGQGQNALLLQLGIGL